jgi:hypothetical protein
MLSDDLHCRIVSRIPTAEVATSALVCRYWREKVRDNVMWQGFVARDLPGTSFVPPGGPKVLGQLQECLVRTINIANEAAAGSTPATQALSQDLDGGDYWRQRYITEFLDRRWARVAGAVVDSPFHAALFKACGKIPDVPSIALLKPLLDARDFCGDADAYLVSTL